MTTDYKPNRFFLTYPIILYTYVLTYLNGLGWYTAGSSENKPALAGTECGHGVIRVPGGAQRARAGYVD